jgi:sigma-B regulation protein RsbU (phosphoserine phosphatase)
MAIRMMVVDDEPDLETLIRQKFRKEIRENLFEFLFAQNGVEALTKIAENPDVRLVLTDINMPEMDGLTLLEKIADLRKPALKAVIISAYGDMENIRTAMNRGAFDFLTKPIDFSDLDTTIKKSLEHLEFLFQATTEHELLVSLKSDLTTAARIQQSILPQDFPPFPDRTEIDIFADMVSAKDVGGDFYDFFFLDKDRLGVVIGDVSGKGIPAAIFMAVSRTLLKAIASQVVNPGETLRRMNSMLLPEGKGKMFVTILYGVLNTKTGEFQYSRGGHPPAMLKRADGSVEMLDPTGGGFLLGMIDDMEYDVYKVPLAPGDTLLVYTDGVTEAMDAEQQLFDDSRLLACLSKQNGEPLDQVIHAIQREIDQFTTGIPQSDDITMLALRYRGARGKGR